VNVTTVQASGDATATAETTPTAEPDSRFWTRGRKIGAFIVGVAGIAGAVFAGIQAF